MRHPSSSSQRFGIAGCRNWHLQRSKTPQWLPRLHRAGPSTSLDEYPCTRRADQRPLNSVVSPKFTIGDKESQIFQLVRSKSQENPLEPVHTFLNCWPVSSIDATFRGKLRVAGGGMVISSSVDLPGRRAAPTGAAQRGAHRTGQFRHQVGDGG